jgi:hypothetical protein
MLREIVCLTTLEDGAVSVVHVWNREQLVQAEM